MSLQVWLPLTKDLRNQGLASITSSGTPVFKNSGKLGSKSLDLNTRINFSCPALNNVSTFSVAFWAKTNQDNNISGYWMDVLGLTDISTSGSGGQLRWETCYTTGAPTRGISAHDNATYATVQGPSGQATVKGNWNHFCITVDPSGSGRAIEYWDGVKIGDYAANGGHLNGNFWTGETNKVNGEIQDVRIYNHALSPLEVKHISQGLILHYPLNRGGWGQENLALNTHNLNLYSNKNNLYMYFRGAATRRLRVDGFYEAYCTGDWQGLSFWANQLNLKSGDKITYSFYIYTNGTSCGYSFYPMIWNSSGSRDTSTTIPISIDGDNYTNGNARTFGSTTATSPEKHYVIFEWNDSVKAIIDNGGSIELSIQVHGGNWTNRWACIYAPKIEKGDKVTPWCPNSSDALATTMGLNDNVEYDVSGYCNNGIKVGTFDYDSDTPKYNVSTSFNGVDNCIQLENISSLLQDVFTINLWFKKDSLGSKAYETLFGGPSGFEMDTRSGSSQTLSLYMASTRGGNVYSSFNFGEWYMVTLVNDGTNELYYVNGELVKTITKKSMPSGNYFIGAWQLSSKQNYKGLISDFRIYATALSADDVKSLYQNSAYIDNQGNIYGAVYEEV